MNFSELNEGDFFRHADGKHHVFVKRQNGGTNAVWLTEYNIGIVCCINPNTLVQKLVKMSDATFGDFKLHFSDIKAGEYFMYDDVKYQRVRNDPHYNAVMCENGSLVRFTDNANVKTAK